MEGKFWLEEETMHDPYHVSLGNNGHNQVLTIPSEFTLPNTEVTLRKEGDRLIIEPVPSTSLLALLKTLKDVTDSFPDVDRCLPPLDDICSLC